MELLTWKPKYSVGIDEIDAQHKELLRMLNELNSAMRNKKGYEYTEIIIQRFIEFTLKIFKAEENYMDCYNYHMAMRHKKEHQQLIDDLVAFKNRFQADKAALTPELLNYLKNWLRNHISGTDKALGRFLADKEKNKEGLT